MTAPERPGPIIPDATYRLQFHRDFTFRQAAALVPYLNALGISHCYASPLLKARPGSPHGYDIVAHDALNPEIGTQEEFEDFVATLKRHGMGLIMDIVPNHMAVMGDDNRWWQDVLENGPASRYARFFDIDWRPLKPALKNKVLLPVLGDQYGIVLERGELSLHFSAAGGEFSIHYFQHRFPVDPRTYPEILLSPEHPVLPELPPDHSIPQEFISLAGSFGKLPPRDAATIEETEERRRDQDVFKRRLAEACRRHPAVVEHIRARVEAINGDPLGDLHRLLESQAYRLAFWRVAGDEINYRRFFDINELAGLRMEDEEVFSATHSLVLELIRTGHLEGLRIDHADGLLSPMRYFVNLNNRIAAMLKRPEGQDGLALYLVAEKIVADYEYPAEDWPIHGTTGYEFANLVNGLLIDPAGEALLRSIYARFVGGETDFDDIVYRSKKQVMNTAMSGELSVLANRLAELAAANPKSRDYTDRALREALCEVIARFPVYRTYVESPTVRKEDRQYIQWAVAQAKRSSESPDKSVFDFISRILLLDLEPSADHYQALGLVMKFQQYTAPVMAKGYEDTALYRFHPLVALNEVGGDPRRFGVSVSAFHHLNQSRGAKWPHSLLCLSTHDSKRSGDVRARIDVLSEIPRQWRATVNEWRRMNRPGKVQGEDGPAPSANDEYLFYQTLVGSWPLGAMDAAAITSYRERLQTYMIKAAREAKQQTSWTNPNDAYEKALRDFVAGCLDPGAAFFESFRRFAERIENPGLCNALSQTLLHLTCPGVPDIYQGEEIWRFSLVDPDNRRPVDFELRQRLLTDLLNKSAVSEETSAGFLPSLLEDLPNGRVKLFLIATLLRFRRNRGDLFRYGDYVKLNVEGPRSTHLVAFQRRFEDQAVLIVVPRLIAAPLMDDIAPLGNFWSDCRIELPKDSSPRWRNLFDSRPGKTRTENEVRYLEVASLLDRFPWALLEALPS